MKEKEELKAISITALPFGVEGMIACIDGGKRIIMDKGDGEIYICDTKDTSAPSIEHPKNKPGISANKGDIPSPGKDGKKNDFKDDKLRWDLLPLEEIEDIVKVYHAGAKKYGENTWQSLPNGKNRYKAALLRHLMEYEKGNKIDEETGCSHLAQCAWNAIAMLYLDKHGK